MAFEKQWESVSQSFTGDGTIDGKVPVLDASGFYAKQVVILKSSAFPDGVTYEVRRVFPTIIQVALKTDPWTKYADVTAFLLADGATITAPEQTKPTLKPEDIFQALYHKDPAVALRNLLVNKFGFPIDTVVGPDGKTRLAVDAAVTVTGLSVDLDAMTPPTRPDPDNVLVVGSEDGTKTGVKHAFVNNLRKMITSAHDVVPTYTYADFGTKDQRITRIDYVSATFPGYIARRDFNYVLDSGRYRRINGPWSIV